MAIELLEGTWEEITQHSEELAGRRVQVRVLTGDAKEETGVEKPRTPDEWLEQFNEWVSSFRTDVPAISDEALRREAMYEERGR